VWRRVFIVLVSVCLVCLAGQHLIADEDKDTVPPKANVFVYPKKLTERDQLADGPKGRTIEIKTETTLIWVDLAPDYRFAHPTEYVLISARGTRIVKGHWWPALNGKPLFRDGSSYKADFPVKLVGK
jgi:hypothetical protein